jgi:hypothetical protein
MDKTVWARPFPGMRNVTYFCLESFSFSSSGSFSQQHGRFLFAEWDVFLPLFSSLSVQKEWWVLFHRNSLTEVAGQYPATGSLGSGKGLRKHSLCSAVGHSQSDCCLKLVHISSTVPPARSFLVDQGKRMSSLVFLCMWSPFYHLVAGEENRESWTQGLCKVTSN